MSRDFFTCIESRWSEDGRWKEWEANVDRKEFSRDLDQCGPFWTLFGVRGKVMESFEPRNLQACRSVCWLNEGTCGASCC